MTNEDLKAHIRKTIREYLEVADYPIPPGAAREAADALCGSAFLSGMALMTDWQSDLAIASATASWSRDLKVGCRK